MEFCNTGIFYHTLLRGCDVRGEGGGGRVILKASPPSASNASRSMSYHLLRHEAHENQHRQQAPDPLSYNGNFPQRL
jgi:hypothetical protein